MAGYNKGSKNPMYKVSGNLSPRWKGGKQRVNGYVFVWKPDHPYSNNRGYVPRARLVMEQHIGRYLGPSEIVHHKNGIRDDDRIENFSLLRNRSEHMALPWKIKPLNSYNSE